MKTTKKITKKIFKPAYIIDLTDCETEEDFLIEKAWAKYEAGLDINTKEADALIDDAIDVTIEEMFDGHNAAVIEGNTIIGLDAVKVEVEEKKPWYKRFWNWLTRK